MGKKPVIERIKGNFERFVKDSENRLAELLKRLETENDEKIHFDGRLVLAKLPWGVSFLEEEIRKNLAPYSIFQGNMIIEVHPIYGSAKPYRVFSEDRNFRMLVPVVGKWMLELRDPNLKYLDEGPFLRASAMDFGDGAEFRFYCSKESV